MSTTRGAQNPLSPVFPCMVPSKMITLSRFLSIGVVPAVGGALGKDRAELVEVLKFTMPLYVDIHHAASSPS